MRNLLCFPLPFVYRVLLLSVHVALLQTLPATDLNARASQSQNRNYILDDFDYNTTAGQNDFFGNAGRWDYGGALISTSYEPIGGTNFCLKVAFDLSTPSSAGGWWEQFAYEYGDPDNPVFDLRGYEEFRFSVRGEGTSTSRFFIEFVQGTFEKSIRVEITGVTDAFQERVIVLHTALAGFDLTRMRQVAVVLENAHVTQKTGTLYFDNLYFVGKEEGYTTDAEFLDLVSRKAFGYFIANVHPQTGLVRDKASNRSISSIAAVGFQLTALGIGAERQWITRNEAASRTKKILETMYHAKHDSSIGGAAGYKGFFYHLLDIATAARDGTSELSSIDASLFFAGVLFAREYFADGADAVEGEIRGLADSIINRVSWQWMLDKSRNQFYMEWKPGQGFGTPHWDYYTDETLLVTLLAIGSGEVDPSVFYAWQRVPGSYGGFHLIRSWWGALFTHFFAHCWFNLEPLGFDLGDPDSVNWWNNSLQAARANKQFCLDMSAQYRTYSDSSWGLTDCFGPGGYNGGGGKSYGAYPLGDPPPNHDGTIPPSGAGSCIIFFSKDPGQNESIRALKNYYNNFPKLWGIYGLKDSYNLGTLPDSTDDWYADEYVGLGVGPLLLMIENYRTGLVWKYFMRNVHIQDAVRKVFRGTVDAREQPLRLLPENFRLLQNYPNPFNPATTIAYEVPRASHVRLSVHDLLGRTIAVVVDERKEAGRHQASFSAQGCASGVCFYRVQAGGYVATKRMLLLK